MRYTDLQLFEKFQEVVRWEIPDFKVAYKTDSTVMKVLAFLMRPFNPTFLEKYVTTWGSVVYYPSEEHVHMDPMRALCVLAHELVHLCDSRDHGLWGFHMTYAAPQIYAVVPLAAYSVMGSAFPLLILVGSYLAACVLASKKWLAWGVLGLGILATLIVGWILSGLWIFLLLGSLVPIAMPSSSRTKWELRGYAMTLAVQRWATGYKPPAEQFEHIRTQFNGPNYFFMCWSRGQIEKSLEEAYEKVESGRLRDEDVYDRVHDFFVGHELLQPRPVS